MKRDLLLKKPALLAFALTLLQYALLRLVLPCLIYGDDVLAEIALSGGYAPAAIQNYPFYSGCFVALISFLYSVCGTLPWIGLFLEGCTFLSCYAIQYSLLRVGQRLAFSLCELFYLLLFSCCILPVSVALSFTTVAGLCGAGAVCLLLSAILTGGHRRAPAALSAAMLALAFLLRFESGLVCFCFYMLAAVFGILYLRVSPVRACAAVLAIAACCCGFRLLDRQVSDCADRQTIDRWNDARSYLIDYNNTSYQEDPACFAAIGWNEPLYDLELSWYHLDEKFDYQHFNSIRTYVETNHAPRTLLRAAADMVRTLYKYGKSWYYIPLFLLFFGLFAACIYFSLKQWRQHGRLLFALSLCAVGGTVLMWLYLSYAGRLVGHVLRLCCIPSICLLALLCLFLCRSTAPRKGFVLPAVCVLIPPALLALLRCSGSKVTFLLAALLCAALFFFSLLHAEGRIRGGVCAAITAVLICLPIFTTAQDAKVMLSKQPKYQAEQAYVKANPTAVFVSAREYTPVRLDLIHAQHNHPTNLFYSVDFLLFSEAYEEKLACNHLDAMNIATLLEDNVYFIGDSEADHTVALLLDYMKTQYGDTVTASVCRTLDGGVSVYQFQKGEPQ